MELLIVLGLCFGAYELLGVFQGCFHYKEHPFPYQPKQININSSGGSNGNNNSLNGNNDDTIENDNENDTDDKIEEYQCERRKLDKSELRRKIRARKLAAAAIHLHQQQLQLQHHDQEQQQQPCEFEEEEEDEEEDDDEEYDDDEILKTGPCSCVSTVTETDIDDDTKIILRNCNSRTRRHQNTHKPINKFSLSKSLMSLNRDDSSFLFNYIDSVNSSSNKFSKFKSEIEISETSFSRNYNKTSDSHNDRRTYRNCRDNFDNLSLTLSSSHEKHNEINDCNASVNLDTNQKKIFFISAAS